MSTVAQETNQARDLIERIETLEDVAKSLPEHDERRSALLDLVEKDLAGAPALRPRIAAELLGLSEKTVRAWVEEGVLTRAAGPSARLLLDASRGSTRSCICWRICASQVGRPACSTRSTAGSWTPPGSSATTWPNRCGRCVAAREPRDR